MKPRQKMWGIFLAASFVLTACSSGTTDTDVASDFGEIGDCTPITAAISSEKMGLFKELSDLFQSSSEASSLANCAKIDPIDSPSGEAAQLLKNHWPLSESVKKRPVIWSPASSSWVNEVTGAFGVDSIGESVSIARSPVVIAMPEPMAQALGWPDQPIGLRDLHNLCLDEAGWGKFGPGAGSWGDFKLGKTNPYSSTTGQNILLMQDYAATGKQAGLTREDVTAATEFSRELESCVIHYGDTTGNVLDRAYDLDQQGQPLGYISAVAVEETSVINYNIGNPTSAFIKEGDVLTKPRGKMVAVYPSEGSLQSDNPLVVLNNATADWVSPEQREAAVAFQKFALTPAAQKVLGDYGFRPADPSATPTGLVSAEYGANPALPSILLEQPSVAVTTAAKQQWDDVRKPSRVLVLIDRSGSMGNDAGNGQTRIQVAKDSVSLTLDHFRPQDELGVSTFTLPSNPASDQLRPVSPLGNDAEQLEVEIRRIQPGGGTPLYDTVYDAYTQMKADAEPGRINAIILLSDGEDAYSQRYRDIGSLVDTLFPDASNEVVDDSPVRIFPIAYSDEASSDILNTLAVKSGGQFFDASDPKRLSLVFQSVINNF